MGATTSTDVATHFFEESKSLGYHLNLKQKASNIRVADEGVKLMPGGALVVEAVECPLHQIGDGKGVSGQLKTVDSLIPKPVESNKQTPYSRSINQRSKLQKNIEETSSVMSAETQNEFPGKMPPITIPGNEASTGVKPVIIMEEVSKPQDPFKSATTLLPEKKQAGSAMLISSECPMKPHNPPQDNGPNPLSELQSIPPKMNKPAVPVIDHASFEHKFGSSETHLIQEEGRPRPLNKKISTDKKIPSPNWRLGADHPFPPAAEVVMPNIPKTDTKEVWSYLSRQMFWNALLRKGWKWDKADMSSEEMENILSVYNANNQLAWKEILKWEAMHADECTEPKLKSFSIFAKKYSPRARLRSWLGYEFPFDRHDWIVDRNGKEVRYIIDYYDGGKLNTNFEFALLDVRPALDSFEALWDRMRVAMKWGTTGSQDAFAQVVTPVPDLSSASGPLNLGKKPVSDGIEKSQEVKPSRFVPYSLSDIEKERERKNSVS